MTLQTTDAIRLRMSRQASRDTGPERALRSLLHRHGLRYRLHQRPLSGMRRQADIVFRRARVAVFVDGCFWHACPEHGTSPRANGAWWQDKLAANVARDRDTDERLREAGWTVVRVWEHEDPVAAAQRLVELVRERKPVDAGTYVRSHWSSNIRSASGSPPPTDNASRQHMTRRSDASWAEETDAHRRKPDRQDRQDAAELGRRVRSRRKELHLSQERLGEISGLHRTYIGHVERGEVNPTLHNVLLMAHALGLDAGELVRGLRADIDPADPEPGTGTVVDQHTQATRGGGTTSTTE